MTLSHLELYFNVAHRCYEYSKINVTLKTFSLQIYRNNKVSSFKKIPRDDFRAKIFKTWLSFKTQFKIEFLLQDTGSRKVLGIMST